MSIAPGLCKARLYQPGRTIGQSCCTSSSSSSRTPETLSCPSASTRAKHASSPVGARVITPRGASSGCAAKPAGGASKNGSARGGQSRARSGCRSTPRRAPRNGWSRGSRARPPSRARSRCRDRPRRTRRTHPRYRRPGPENRSRRDARRMHPIHGVLCSLISSARLSCPTKSRCSAPRAGSGTFSVRRGAPPENGSKARCPWAIVTRVSLEASKRRRAGFTGRPAGVGNGYAQTRSARGEHQGPPRP